MSNAFFRIRQKLAMDNRFGKFVGVALVEMVLIIAGILIALQIDNWNQTNQESKIVKEYLEIIKHNVANDLKELEILKEHREQTLDYTTTILGYYENEHVSDPKLFELGFMSIFLEQRLFPNRNAYESLKSSGFLRNLGSTSIEEALNAYYTLLDKVLTYEEAFTSITVPIEENLSESGFYIEYTDMFSWNHQDTINFTYEDLRKYPDVQSTFIRSNMWLGAFLAFYADLLNNGKALQELLDSADLQK